MAGRPPKEGLDYFPFEVGFFSDDKVESLEGEHGPIGTYVFMRLLCLIYKDNGYFYQWNDSARVLMARRIGGLVTPQKVELIVRSCVRWSLFDCTLFNAYAVLTSPGIQRRYLNAIKERARKAAAEGRHIEVDDRFWLVDKNTTAKSFVKVGLLSDNPGNNGYFSVEELPNSPAESPKEKKSKEKESKEKREESAASPSPPPATPTHTVGVVSLPSQEYDEMCSQYGKDVVDAKILHMDEWIMEKGARPKSCAAKLRSWLANDQVRQSAAPDHPRPMLQVAGKRTGAHAYEQRTYTDEELSAMLYTDLDKLND